MRKWLKKQMDKLTSPDLDWVQVEVSTFCNASCGYCPHTALKPYWINRNMSLDLFRELLPFLSRTHLVFLQGWGEPLLNPALFEMIRLSRNQGNRTGFTTNGMLLTEETALKLIDLEADILGVSIAGTRAQTHNRIRKGTDLDQITRNFERLKELKAEKGSEPPEIHLAYLLLRSNFEELREIVPLAQRMGAGDVVVSNLSLLVDPDLALEPIFTDTENLDKYRFGLKRIRQEAEAEGIRFSCNGPGLNEQSFQCGENVRKACVIGVEGEVVPCVMTDPVLSGKHQPDQEQYPCYIFNNHSYFLIEMVFGRIGEEKLTRIWNKPEYRSFRHLFTPLSCLESGEGAKRLPQRCQACYKRLLEEQGGDV